MLGVWLVAAFPSRLSKISAIPRKKGVGQSGKLNVVSMVGRPLTPSCCPILVSKIQKDSHSLIAEGIVGGKQCQLTIDTGANVTIVKSGLLLDAGRSDTSPQNYKLQTASGDVLPVRGRVTTIIEIGSSKFEHVVLIADITDDFILGLDVMSKYGMVVDLKARVLKIGQEDVPLHVPGHAEKAFRVVLPTEVYLPPLTDNLILAELEGDINGYCGGILEPTEGSYKIDGVLVAGTLVKIQRTIPVRLANLNKHEVKLKKGACCGQCTIVASIRNLEIETFESQKDLAIPTELEGLIEGSKKELSTEQGDAVAAFFKEYQTSFACSDRDLSCTDLVQHRINTGGLGLCGNSHGDYR